MKTLIAVLVVALALFPLQAVSQQQPSPFDRAVKETLGELQFVQIACVTEAKRLIEENARLKAQIEEMGKKIAPPRADQPK